MADIQLDPRVKKIQSWAKVGGVVVVAGAASGAVIVAGLGIIAAGVVALGALLTVNFAVPVGARQIALWKQKALTVLAETYSEETIREDEAAEVERVHVLEQQYKISRSELEGAQEELRNQLDGADEATTQLINDQIAALQGVVNEAESTLNQRMIDLEDLKKANKLYIAFQRSAAAMMKAQGAERTAAERARVETARNAIKTRMREAMAGKTIEAMRSSVGDVSKLNVAKVAQLGVSRPTTISQHLNVKEGQHVPRDR